MSSLQKKLAAKILKVGKSRIWLDPTRKKEIDEAITKADIRKLIKKGAIKVLPEKIKKPKEKKRKRKVRKGGKCAVVSRKERWVSTVRALRKMLKEMKSKEEIDNTTFKKLYRLVKGGLFRSKAHLKLYIEQHNLLKKKEGENEKA
ncbi:MAG: 50S ribosomal protein L19e [Candidatus Aenigmatarchaeota archaeon]